MDYISEYQEYKKELQAEISELLGKVPELLGESMAYTVLNGGKRMRGVLLLAGCELFGVEKEKALKFGAAIEMIHAYSLIHDDMPCMDDDTIRRGQPCNHIKFGEANALLAGDSLLNYAYEILLESAKDLQDIEAISYLAKSAGIFGMIKGQSLDIISEGQPMDFEVLKEIHRCKTGALIKAAAIIPAILAKADEQTIQAIGFYGENIGVAFQITDDVLDEIGVEEEIGKTVGKDAQSDKMTYVKLFGVEISSQMAKDKVQSAIDSLHKIDGNVDFLSEIARNMVDRIN